MKSGGEKISLKPSCGHKRIYTENCKTIQAKSFRFLYLETKNLSHRLIYFTTVYYLIIC